MTMTQEQTKDYIKYIEKFRKKYIPMRYNQIKLMEDLPNPDLDHYVSISNRSDGKSFNYIHYILNLAIDYGVGITLIARHYTLRQAYQKLVFKIVDASPKINTQHINFMRTDFYITILYKNREIGIITDLNQATDLKYLSNHIQDFPMIVYDEFLAIEGDYLPDEWVRLKTIYSSINRRERDIPVIGFPKLLYLGNAVNFSSPIIANLELFNILEKHEMNTKKQYGNIILETNRNDNANEIRNMRAFKEENDDMSKGEFTINKHNIASENDKMRIRKNPSLLYVKLNNDYLQIMYNRDTFEAILSIVAHSEEYNYNLNIKDNIETSIYLKDTYFSEKHYKKYNMNAFYFDNMYSKDYILEDFGGLKDLKINKLIMEHETLNNKSNFEVKEEQFILSYVEQTKKNLHRKFFG